MHQKNILKSPQNHGLCYNVAWDYRGNRGDLLLTDVVVAVVVVVVCFYCCCCWCCCLFSWMWLALLSSPTCVCIRWCYSPSSALMKIILQGPVSICSTMFNVNFSCGLWSFRKLALNILNVDEEHLDYYEWERWGIFFWDKFSVVQVLPPIGISLIDFFVGNFNWSATSSLTTAWRDQVRRKGKRLSTSLFVTWSTPSTNSAENGDFPSA